MNQQYHILNGDALKEQLPKSISGKMIVTRECLIEGGVKSENLEEFYDTRANFISKTYPEFTKKDYYDITVSEFEKIKDIPDSSVINLWFEDDLFCQVNFWFILSLLKASANDCDIYLIRPLKGHEYSFGTMKESQLNTIYKNKVRLSQTEIDKITHLWVLYQNSDFDSMAETAKELESKYPFLLPAIQAHIDRFPKNGESGRPTKTLIDIMDRLQTKDFKTIFKEFLKTEAIYGFGDLQVKKLIENIRES